MGIKIMSNIHHQNCKNRFKILQIHEESHHFVKTSIVNSAHISCKVYFTVCHKVKEGVNALVIGS